MNYIKLFILSLAVFQVQSALACLRVDIEDRKPDKVFQHSIDLGKGEKPTEVAQTGIRILVRNKTTGQSFRASGVALDRYTVLTAAHTKGLGDEGHIVAISHGDENKFFTVKKVILHNQFQLGMPTEREVKRNPERDEFTLNSLNVKEFEQMSFPEIRKMFPPEFSGPDLAIIKAAKPLFQSISYPKIWNPKQEMEKETYGISIGYGDKKWNNQEKGPIIIDDLKKGSRHVISCKVSLHPDLNLYFGMYKGLLVNGNESFIPDSSMKKTEGLPVNGDSGGPLFITSKSGEYQLAGIFSGTTAPNNKHLLENGSQDDQIIRGSLFSIKQPVHPYWTSVWEHREWIQSYMGSME